MDYPSSYHNNYKKALKNAHPVGSTKSWAVCIVDKLGQWEYWLCFWWFLVQCWLEWLVYYITMIAKPTVFINNIYMPSPSTKNNLEHYFSMYCIHIPINKLHPNVSLSQCLHMWLCMCVMHPWVSPWGFLHLFLLSEWFGCIFLNMTTCRCLSFLHEWHEYIKINIQIKQWVMRIHTFLVFHEEKTA